MAKYDSLLAIPHGFSYRTGQPRRITMRVDSGDICIVSIITISETRIDRKWYILRSKARPSDRLVLSGKCIQAHISPVILQNRGETVTQSCVRVMKATHEYLKQHPECIRGYGRP